MRLYAENNTNYIKSLDNGSLIKLLVIDDDNSPMDLTEFEKVVVKIGNDELGTILNIEPNTTDANGVVEFSISTSLPSGKYFIEIHMFVNTNTVRIAPSEYQFQATITKSMGELRQEIAIISVQQLISDMNEVKTLSEDSNAKVTQAVASANNAVDVANIADINANNALTTSQTAISNSSEALVKANKAIDDSQTALSNSNKANSNSSNALSNSETALSNSQTALSNSNEALTKANKSIDDSSEALTKANKAIDDSSESLTKANKSIDDSELALTTANEAKSLATTADTNASQAKSDSATALSTANNAKNVADQVRSEFDQIVSGNTDAEVINARTNADGTTFTNVKARLDDSDSKLNQATTNISNLQQTLANVDKNSVGLGNVDNTSDLDKPISTATQTALDDKADKLDLQKLINEGFLNSYATDVDANGYYTGVTFKRNDSTIYLVSTLSNPDANDYYQTCTWDFYDVDGITITSTKTWTFTYDSNGKIITKEVA